jgi:hypothetical protein
MLVRTRDSVEITATHLAEIRRRTAAEVAPIIEKLADRHAAHGRRGFGRLAAAVDRAECAPA